MRSPFQLFFPVGLGLSLAGVLLWTLFALEWISFYPGALHADLMIGGFFFCFVAGFLLTATPRFTGTSAASRTEVLSIFALVIALAALSWRVDEAGRGAFRAISALAHLGVLVFFIRRARAGKRLPKPFALVAAGLISGVLGACLLAAADWGWMQESSLRTFGRLLYVQGMIVGVVLGIGGRMVAALLGWVDELRADRVFWAAGVFYASFALEAWWSLEWAAWVRFSAIAAVGLGAWKLHRLPRMGSRVAYLIWFSAWFIVLGYFLSAIWPTQALHLMHVTYTSGLGLLTLMIAIRVTLSHGGHDLAYEWKSWSPISIATLVVIAAATRVSIVWLPQVYLSHLAYAAVTWAVAVLAWAVFFFPKLGLGRKVIPMRFFGS